ncbi:hypothetical protein J2Z84_002104 [Agrobacterium rubi]|nr:hypothetical protein [Agrobacterium rubi]
MQVFKHLNTALDVYDAIFGGKRNYFRTLCHTHTLLLRESTSYVYLPHG